MDDPSPISYARVLQCSVECASLSVTFVCPYMSDSLFVVNSTGDECRSFLPGVAMTDRRISPWRYRSRRDDLSITSRDRASHLCISHCTFSSLPTFRPLNGTIRVALLISWRSASRTKSYWRASERSNAERNTQVRPTILHSFSGRFFRSP